MSFEYFVPCSELFKNAVQDKTAPRYWRVLIDRDGDGQLEDVTGLLKSNKISGSGKMGGRSGEAVSNQYKVTLKNRGGFFREGDLAGAYCAVEAKVGDAEYIRLFTGFVSGQGAMRSASHISSDTISLDLVDYTKHRAVNRKTEKRVFVGFTISDPENPENSVFHRLVQMMGLSPEDLDVGDKIDFQKSFLSFDGSTTVFRELQDLAAQYLGLLTFRYDGKLRFRSRFEAGWEEPESEWVLDETNVHSLSGKGGEIQANKVTTEFEEYQVLELRVIHKNVEDYNVVTGRINIVVLPGDYWPGPGAEDKAQLSYREPSGEGEEYPIGINIQVPVIGATGAEADIECTGGLLELASFNGEAGFFPERTRRNPGSSEIILYNPHDTPVTITRFQIWGQPVRINKKITVEDLDRSVGEEWEYKEMQIPGRYGVSPEQAHMTTGWWLEYGKVKRREYDLVTDWLPQVQEGAKVTLNLPSLGISMVGVVTAYNHPSPGGPMTKQTTRLSVREDYFFTAPPGTPNVITQNLGQAGAEAADTAGQQIGALEEEVNNRPTFQELQSGYSHGGGTTLPEVPVLAVCEAVGVKAVMLATVRQLNLTNFSHYEWQVSEDGVAWFALRFDGGDWKGDAGEVTKAPTEFLTHAGIPHRGSAEAPEGRKLFYHLRRVTKAGSASGWSEVKSAVTRTVSSGDLAAGSVFANNLVAGIVNAMVAQINNFLEVGGDGFIGKTYGALSGYQECGLTGIDRTGATGLLPDHTYYFRVDTDGRGPEEFVLVTGSDTTYGGIIERLNALAGGFVFDLVQGDLRCSSLATGAESSISLDPGISGDDLFAALPGFSGFEEGVAGRDNVLSWGATRSRLFEDSWMIEFWDGESWRLMLKGGGRYNGQLFPYLQAPGLIAPGAESQVDGLDIGERIPGSSLLFKFDGGFTDQVGNDPWSVKDNIAFDNAVRKFGTHSLGGLAGGGRLAASFSVMSWAFPFSMDFWFYQGDTEAEKLFFETGVTGGELLFFNPTASLVAEGVSFPVHDECLISEERIAGVIKNGQGLELRLGIIDSRCGVTWEEPLEVSPSITSFCSVIKIDVGAVLVCYTRTELGVPGLYLRPAFLSGVVFSHGPEVLAAGVPGRGFTSALNPGRFILVYEKEESLGFRAGTVSGGAAALGEEVGYNYDGVELQGVLGMGADRFLVSYRQTGTDLLIILPGYIDGMGGITLGLPVEASEAYGCSVSRLIKVDEERTAVFFQEMGVDTLYMRQGRFFEESPSLGPVTMVKEYISQFAGAALGQSRESGEMEIILNVRDSSGNGVLSLVRILDNGEMVVDPGECVFASQAQGLNILALNSYLFLPITSVLEDGVWKVDIRGAGKAGYSLFQWSAGVDRFVCRFLHTSAGSGETVWARHTFFKETGGWFHISVNAGSAGIYATCNGTEVFIDLEGLTLNSGDISPVFELGEDDRLDDLLVVPLTNSLSHTGSIEHFKNNVRWSLELDFKKDIILTPAPGGRVHIAGNTTGQVYAVYAP